MQKNLDNFFKGPKKVRDESKDNKLPKPSVEEKEAASQPPKPVEKSSQKAKRSSNSKEMIVEEPAAEKPEPKPPTPSVTKKLEYRTTEIKNIEFELYEPKKHAPFSKHQLAPFFFICECFDLVAEMKGANSVEKKKRVLINMVKTFELLNPSEAADFYLFATGRLDAEYLQEDLGVGNETMLKSCAHAAGSNRKTIKEEVDKVGDLGKVIEERKAKTQTVDSFFTKKVVDNKRVTFQYVFSEINKLTKFTGQKEKESILNNLLFECTGLEAKVVIRFLQGGNFKMGCAKATIQSSLARAYFEVYQNPDHPTSSETWEKALQRSSHQYPNYRLIIQGLQNSKGDPHYLMQHCRLTPGIPCKPMLAKPTKGINVIFQRFEGKPFTCEFKYDGLRGQVHYVNGRILVYSRNLENMTAQYPDICKNILSAVKPEVKNFIVDSEIVGFDQKTGKILPFQILMSRAKKNVEIDNIQNQVCLFLFDCLYLDGQSLLESPLKQRRDALRSAFNRLEHKVEFVVSKEAEDFESIQEFLNESVKVGCEGLMVKTIEENSVYEPCIRSYRWLKLKRDYLEESLSDSLDLVAVGAKFGEGKRTGYYGTLLLASYNSDSERFETTGMVGAGFTDDDLKVLFDKLSPLALKEPHSDVFVKEGTGAKAIDVWLTPKHVLEIMATDIQISPLYTCGYGICHESRGLGLRFPRYLKLREDKDPEDCSPTSLIVDMYNQQAAVMNNEKQEVNFDDEEDEY